MYNFSYWGVTSFILFIKFISKFLTLFVCGIHETVILHTEILALMKSTLAIPCCLAFKLCHLALTSRGKETSLWVFCFNFYLNCYLYVTWLIYTKNSLNTDVNDLQLHLLPTTFFHSPFSCFHFFHFLRYIKTPNSTTKSTTYSACIT